ncbi:MAG TPA: mobilization protein [Rhizobacter sp.]|nr:mobilization protein [Rhizobacter sp.]
MSNIHFIGGEKGGVGKSLVARVLAQYLIDKQLAFLGFDTDRSHGALMRFYSGYASPVLVDRYEALDAIVEATADQPDRRILVDLAAQTHEPLVRWMDDSGVLNLVDEMGSSIFYWHVMDSGKDSVDLLKRLLDRFGPSLKYVLVRNQVRGNDFSVLEQSGEQARALAMGAKVVSLRKLHDSVINKIDAASSSFWKAKTGEPGGGSQNLGLMERQRLKMWLREVYRELDEVGV